MMPATRTRCELRRTPLQRLYEKSRMHRRRSFQNYRNATFWPISLHRLTGFAVEASLEPTFHTVSKRLSEKSLGGLWSVGFGSATLQERALCTPFRQFVSSFG